MTPGTKEHVEWLMKRFLCFIFGHPWFIRVTNEATCKRCNKKSIKVWKDNFKRK